MDIAPKHILQVLPAAAGAGTAYLIAMWLDSKLSSHSFNDLKLVGQMFTTRRPHWLLLGLTGHYGFSVLMSLLYTSWTCPKLPGPRWLRGVLFLQIENLLLYPAGLVLDRFHAGIKQGQVPRMLNWKSFKGQVVRHVAFGAVLGLMAHCRRD